MQQSPSVSRSGLPTQIHQCISEIMARSLNRDKSLLSSSCPSVRPSVCLSVCLSECFSAASTRLIYVKMI